MNNTNQLKCPKCELELRVEEVLDKSTVSWPQQKWILFNCSNCNNTSFVSLGNNKIEIGDIDGAPGPCFVIYSRKDCKGLKVSITDNYVECTFNSKTHKYLKSQQI